MTGRLYVSDDDGVADADRWVHFRLQLDEGKQLRFSDSRKFGKVYLTTSLEEITRTIGPEPLDDDFTPDVLHERLQNRSKMIKPLLLDQSFIAGVGNIYADEALHRANIHPMRRADTLTDEELSAYTEPCAST
jgi:formamidopyrimidine-DNA glycosylase